MNALNAVFLTNINCDAKERNNNRSFYISNFEGKMNA